MKKTILILLVLSSIFYACTESASRKPEKSQLEINKENAEKDKGDHVTDARLIPPLTSGQKKQYIDSAKFVAKTAFNIFSSHLKRLFEEKHPVEALSFCKENALRITDSLSKAHGVSIKRTSFRLRNPDNKPTEQEEKVMEIFKERIHKNLKPEPYVHYDEYGNPHVYLPIIVQEKCLMCHGDPNKEIPEEIVQKLAELYPSDKAIFFKKGDLRGIWSIKFPKKN